MYMYIYIYVWRYVCIYVVSDSVRVHEAVGGGFITTDLVEEEVLVEEQRHIQNSQSTRAKIYYNRGKEMPPKTKTPILH